MARKKTTNLGTLSRLAKAANMRGQGENYARVLSGLMKQLYGVNKEGDISFMGGLDGDPENPARPGVVDEVLALPMLIEAFGGQAPEFAKKAQARTDLISRRVQEEMDLDDAQGFEEQSAEALGTMLGQLPVGAAKTAKVAATGVGKVARAAKAVPAALVEWLSPTIRPGVGNYTSGALAGAITNTLAEEPMDKDLHSLSVKYADGGRVTKALKVIKDAMAHLDAGDVSSAVTTLRSSRDAMASPAISELVRSLRSSAQVPGAKRRLTGMVEAETNANIMPTYKEGGHVTTCPHCGGGI